MTLKDIEAIPQEYLLPKHVSAVLGCDQYTINLAAQRDPDKLGFPVIVTGSRVRIPKDGFLHFMRYGKPAMEPPAAWIEKCRMEALAILETASREKVKPD